MTHTLEKLEALVAKVRALPEPLQHAAVEALDEIANQPYELSAEELAVLEPALEDARSGTNLTEAETDELLDKPWV